MYIKRLFRLWLAPALLAFIVAGCSGNNTNQAPDVSFTTLEGRQFTMQSLRGKVVFIKFWATDCTTCVAQMPGTVQRYNQLSNQGFETIGVAMKHDPESYVRNFTKSRNLPFPIVLDTDGSLAQAFGDIKMTPTSILIDKKGNIIKRYLGNYDEQAFVETVNKALGS